MSRKKWSKMDVVTPPPFRGGGRVASKILSEIIKKQIAIEHLRLKNVKLGQSTIAIFSKTQDFGAFRKIFEPSNSPHFGQKSQFDGCILLVKRFQGATFLQKVKFSVNDEILL